MAGINTYVSAAQLGTYANRVGIEHWEDDEFVVTVDGNVCGQTLHKKEAIEIARWLSCALGNVVSGSIAAERGRLYDELKGGANEIPFDDWRDLASVHRLLETALVHAITSPSITSSASDEEPEDWTGL